MKKLSAVVDTNLFISALIVSKSKPTKLLSLWRQKRFTLVTSSPLLKELEIVLSRPKYHEQYFISYDTRLKLIQSLSKNAHVVSRLTKPQIKIRDPKDLIALATALNGRADYLVTGDNDLLTLKNNLAIQPLNIVTVDEFLKLFA